MELLRRRCGNCVRFLARRIREPQRTQRKKFFNLFFSVSSVFSVAPRLSFVAQARFRACLEIMPNTMTAMIVPATPAAKIQRCCGESMSSLLARDAMKTRAAVRGATPMIVPIRYGISFTSQLAKSTLVVSYGRTGERRRSVMTPITLLTFPPMRASRMIFQRGCSSIALADAVADDFVGEEVADGGGAGHA